MLLGFQPQSFLNIIVSIGRKFVSFTAIRTNQSEAWIRFSNYDRKESNIKIYKKTNTSRETRYFHDLHKYNTRFFCKNQ